MQFTMESTGIDLGGFAVLAMLLAYFLKPEVRPHIAHQLNDDADVGLMPIVADPMYYARQHVD